jgi:ribonuclease T2
MSPQLTAFQHEWAEHGTCYNTLQPSCLPPGSPRGAEAVAFFQRVVGLFQQLPTYQWLAQGGITPSSHQEYNFDDVIDALREASGVRCTRSGLYVCADRVPPQVTPEITCKHGAIQEISWYFYLKGSLIDGNFIPIGKRNDP